MRHGFTSEVGFTLEPGSDEATAQAGAGSSRAPPVFAAGVTAALRETGDAGDNLRRYMAVFRRIVLRCSGFQLCAY
ncbi:hypothetical protein [Methylobacterium planeticum]|uniref:Uncharacterized protein n=1 Tax=Methylobacterium planeticum TaxID=2615211 RepID=A0A6N6MRF3_9HYPH|nr:hypothetical protein [Methylobacterium planeticum]KAB1074315.1 hypothetical protein F6X51_08025 [Methylobacterium planeticum]